MSGACTATLPRCLHAADRGNFTFTFLCFIEHYYRLGMSRSSAVSLVTRLRVGWSRVRIPIVTGDFSVLQNVQEGLWGPPSLLFNGYGVVFPGAKRLGRDVEHSTPLIAQVKNEYSSTVPLFTPICLHGVDRDSFTS